MGGRFNYYYGSQADQFSFIRIPKIILTEKEFSGLSIQSKVLYGVLLDRMTLSRKNRWFDGENRVFIIYQISEIQEDLGYSKKKAMELLSELEKFGLLEKKRRGHGLPNILYVKSFMSGCHEEKEVVSSSGQLKTNSGYNELLSSNCDPKDARVVVMGTSGKTTTVSRSTYKGTLEVTQPTLLEVSIPAPQEVPISGPLKSYTEKNNIEESNIESNHIKHLSHSEKPFIAESKTMRYDETPTSLAAEYRELICDNIEYNYLLNKYPLNRDLIDGIVDLIQEIVMSQSTEG